MYALFKKILITVLLLNFKIDIIIPKFNQQKNEKIQYNYIFYVQ